MSLISELPRSSLAQSEINHCVGVGAVDFVDPPSGSTIFNLEGAINATTLTCNISHSGQQISTQWHWMRGSGSIQDLVPIGDVSEDFVVSGNPDPTDPRFTF